MTLRSLHKISLLFISILFLHPTLTCAQKLSVNLEIKSVIKEDTSNYYIGQLAGIDVDTEGNMYLFDRMIPKIVKLNSSKEYINTIVRGGRGPGEINSVYSFHLNDKKGRILIADRQNRRLMVVNLSGNEKNALTIHPNDMNTPMGMKYYEDNKYVFFIFPFACPNFEAGKRCR